MKIISYNVNGIRAAINKGFIDWLKGSEADVVCLQEIKANKEQVETKLLDKIGYYNYWFSAQKKGYSGVAIYSKKDETKIATKTTQLINKYVKKLIFEKSLRNATNLKNKQPSIKSFFG